MMKTNRQEEHFLIRSKNLLLATRFNNIALLIGYTTLLILLTYFIRIPELLLFPNEPHYTSNSYNDESIGGASTITETTISDSAAVVSFVLDQKFNSPYVGFTFWNNQEEYMDVSDYNEMRITAKVTNLRGLSLALFAQHSLHKEGVDPETLISTSIDVGAEKMEYIIPLNDFKIPGWWFHLNELEDRQEIQIDLAAVHRVNIGSIQTTQTKGGSSFTLYNITFSRNNSLVLIILGCCGILLPVLLILIQYLRIQLGRADTDITVNYQSVTVKERPDTNETFMQFINAHFQQAELTIEQVAHETGVHDRRIAQYIQQTFHCNFKTYVNQLRIAESKRLLTSTDLNAGEIAYAVGFSNQSHFNRVFKNLEDTSPLQYRNTHR
jgi:AraC-like DNA-binding protein